MRAGCARCLALISAILPAPVSAICRYGAPWQGFWFLQPGTHRETKHIGRGSSAQNNKQLAPSRGHLDAISRLAIHPSIRPQSRLCLVFAQSRGWPTGNPLSRLRDPPGSLHVPSQEIEHPLGAENRPLLLAGPAPQPGPHPPFPASLQRL